MGGGRNSFKVSGLDLGSKNLLLQEEGNGKL